MAKFATYVSGAIWWQNLLLMQVVPTGGQICNLCKWRHLVAIFATNASGAIWWPNLQLILVVPYCCQVQPKLRSQFLGPLCLWQCFTASLKLWKHSGTAFYLAPARFPGLLSGQPSREQTTTTWQQLTNFYHDIYDSYIL